MIRSLIPRLIPRLILSLTTLSIGTSSLGWWLPLELLSHFKPQYSLATLILFGLWCGLSYNLNRPRITALLLFSLILQLTILSPWLIPATAATPNGQPFKLISANVYRKNLTPQTTIDWVLTEQPDVAIFIEVNPDWITRLDRHLTDRYPYHISQPSDGSGGIALYSHWPLDQAQLLTLTPHSATTIAATLRHPSGPIDLLALHLPVPFKPTLFTARNQQLTALTHRQTNPRPTILAGDFNLTPWSPYYDRFLTQTHLTNSRHTAAPSWPSQSQVGWLAPILGIPIDHCFVTSDIQTISFKHGPDVGSDHLPIVVELGIGE
jgi:endonuclease/exonuclease/phosphatase (EEP) superfamily protein YafD